MTFSKLVAVAFGFSIIVTTTACQVTPPSPAAHTPSTRVQATSPESQLKRAANSAPDEAARLRLDSAQAYFASGAHEESRTTLQLVDPAHLSSADQFAYYQLSVRQALDVADLPAARAALALAIPTNGAQRNSRALLGADVAEAQSHFEEAAIALMAYAWSGRGDDAGQQAVIDRLWTDINRTPPDRITTLAAGTDTNAAWWQLAAALQSSFDLNAERTAIASWQAHHRDHPAAEWPPSALKQIDRDVAAPTRIGLLLPISGPLANPGRAVRDGFLAAFYHSGSNATVRIYDSNSATIASLYARASSDGAQLIVGPLDKGNVVDINALPTRPVPVLALNYLPPGVKAGAGLFQFGLAIEDEARAIARRVYQDGLYRIVILESDVEWASRAAQAFREQFEALGGTVVTVGIIDDPRAITEVVGNTLLVNTSTTRKEALAKTIGSTPEFIPRRRSDVDAFVALVGHSHARALNPAMSFYFAADVPIYATSQVAGGGTSTDLADLDGLRVTELPWQVYSSAIRTEVDAAFPSVDPTLSPLYALGVDAYRLAARADLLTATATGGLLGETGQLQIQSSGAVVRHPAWAVVSHGALVALPTVAP
jgi:outer membrane PBP1 activator LpoA protein